MSMPQRLLVLVDPTLVDDVSRYVAAPRKREAIALSLAARGPASAGATEVIERAAGIAARLDGAVRARALAETTRSSDDAANYGRRVWNEIAWLSATSGQSWGEGVGRSLAFLAHPERFALAGAPRAVRHLSRAIRHLLSSTADVAPALALPGWEAGLPAWGGSGFASGCIPAEFTEWLGLLLSGERWPLENLATELFGASGARAWRDNARRAARAAARSGCHLLEVETRSLRAQCLVDPRSIQIASSRFDWSGTLAAQVA